MLSTISAIITAIITWSVIMTVFGLANCLFGHFKRKTLTSLSMSDIGAIAFASFVVNVLGYAVSVYIGVAGTFDLVRSRISEFLFKRKFPNVERGQFMQDAQDILNAPLMITKQ